MQISEVKICQFRAKKTSSTPRTVHELSVFLSYFVIQLAVVPKKESLLTCSVPREATRRAVLPRQVVRLSVRPSVMLRYRDHICSNSAKIIPRLISLTTSLSADPNMTVLLQRKHPKF